MRKLSAPCDLGYCWSHVLMLLLYVGMQNMFPISLTRCPAEPGCILPLQTVEEAKWPGSALFVIQYVNSYQQAALSNLICWQLEMCLAS